MEPNKWETNVKKTSNITLDKWQVNRIFKIQNIFKTGAFNCSVCSLTELNDFITIKKKKKKKKMTVRDGATVGKWQPVLWLNTGITANTVYRSKPSIFKIS